MQLNLKKVSQAFLNAAVVWNDTYQFLSDIPNYYKMYHLKN